MASVAAASVSMGTQTFPTENQAHTTSLRGRDVEVLSSDTQESSRRTPDPRMVKVRQVAIEVGRWASYVFAWLVPVSVYLIGVAFAALLSPTTAAASIPAFIASCYAINNHAVPAIGRHFDGLQTS